MLADNNVIHFYPSKFVLITDILDNFGKDIYMYMYIMIFVGNLVFERIREKSSYTPPGSIKSIELPSQYNLYYII